MSSVMAPPVGAGIEFAVPDRFPSGITELSISEMDEVAGGYDALDAMGDASLAMSIVAAGLGSAALVPGPHSFAFGVAGFALGVSSLGVGLASRMIRMAAG